MSMRRENEGQPMGHISIEAAIGQVVGDFEIANVNVYAVYGAERVVDIPIGASFEIHAEYWIINYATTLLDPLYSTSMTVWDLRAEKAGAGVSPYSDNFGDHIGYPVAWLNAHDALNAIMEHEQAMYRVKIWANHAHGAGAPPEERWR